MICTKKGIRREFSNAKTPQQNRVAERRNRTLIEATRTMLADAKLPVTFWAEAVNIACYVQNRVLVNKSQNKTPYELFNSRIHAIGFLRPFGCHVMILNTLDHLRKFDAIGDEGTSSSNISGTKDVASQAVKKDMFSLRYIALLNWFHEAHMETSNDTIRNSDAQDDSQKEQDCTADVPERSGISNPTTTSKVPSADQVEPAVSLTVEYEILTASSPIPTVCLDISPESSSGPRFILEGSANTPMDKDNTWGKDGPGIYVELHLYRSMIGSLMYLTAFRPDIMFDVCACVRHQVTPKDCHLHAVKTIFRYLKGYLKLGLWYPKESPFDLVAYFDSDYDGATQDKKSTTRGCQFMGRRLISMQCKKQTIVATSTTEAEYVAAASGCGQVLWIQNQMLDYGIKTTDQETKIITKVDGKPQTISESSLRRHLKLNYEEGISSLPDADLFENLSLMGYNILPNQSNIATAVVCLATNMVYNFSKMIFDDEPTSLLRDDRHIESFSTVSSLDTGQDIENISKTSAMPHESSPRVPSLDADEDSMQQRLHELMGLCTSLQKQQSQMVDKIKDHDIKISGLKARVKSLEDKERRREEPIQEDAPITGGILDIEEELRADKSTKKGSTDIEEMVNVLCSIEAVNILSSRGAAVSATSVSPANVFPTAGVPTVSGCFPTPMRIPIISAKDKGKEKVTKTEVPKKKKLQEQINAQLAREMEEEFARENQRLSLDKSNEVIAKHLSEYEQAEADLYVGEKIELISELVKYQVHLDEILKYQAHQSKPSSKKEQRKFYMSVLKSHARWKTEHFRGMTLEQIKEKFIRLWKHMQDFVPMSSKEESENVKRPRIKLDQGSSKRVKYTRDKEKELWVELKRLFAPDSEDQLWTYHQALMHDPLDWKLYDTCGVHHVSTKNQEIFMLVEKDYPLRKGLATVMIVQDEELFEASSPELALICGRMFLEESDQVEKYVRGLPDMIQGSVMDSKPKTMQEAIKIANDLLDQKEYAGTLPLCNKCKFYHNPSCTLKNQGHCRSDYQELNNHNHVNQSRGTKARGMVYALGGGETDQDLNNMEDDINA
uniref:Integrase catalytic domain-containing protein n=1 Tax=Tanacetum cinerariifolium TaxID=118510 RepID=A0A6L2P2D5_TANCI|nr:hypothetical protein [Tanacetum cinerariifolium]